MQRIQPGRDSSLDLISTNEVTQRELHLFDSRQAHAQNRRFEQTYVFYQTRDVERTVIDTRDGNDVVHAAPEFAGLLLTDGAFAGENFRDAALGAEDGPEVAGLQAAVFEEEGALDKFEGFASEHGPRFYGLPLNEGMVTLERVATAVPDRVAGLAPFHAGETLNWRFAG